MGKLATGDKAPAFTLPDQDGKPVSSKDFAGRQVVVYFYPRDDTPGYTKEACQFNDNLQAFTKAKVPVLGISSDTAAPVPKLIAYRQRMGWSFPWVSSLRSSFNFDFGVSYTQESVAGGAEHNFRAVPAGQLDPAHLPGEAHGLSAFAREDGVVYHTYSAYARGCDALWGIG